MSSFTSTGVVIFGSIKKLGNVCFTVFVSLQSIHIYWHIPRTVKIDVFSFQKNVEKFKWSSPCSIDDSKHMIKLRLFDYIEWFTGENRQWQVNCLGAFVFLLQIQSYYGFIWKYIIIVRICYPTLRIRRQYNIQPQNKSIKRLFYSMHTFQNENVLSSSGLCLFDM